MNGNPADNGEESMNYYERICTIIDACFEPTPRTPGCRTKVTGKGLGLSHYLKDGHFVLHHRDLPDLSLQGTKAQVVKHFSDLLDELERRANVPAPPLSKAS